MHQDNEKQELRIIERLVAQNSKLIDIVDKLIFPASEPSKPFLTLSIIIQNQTYIMADVSLVLGTPKSGLYTLIDNKTGLPITGVSFSNQAIGANSNPEFATFALDASNNVVGTPVAAGSGTVVLTTDASYTDPGDGSAQSGSFTVTKNFTVIAGADGVTLDVVFQ